jgi:hypothetical protein
MRTSLLILLFGLLGAPLAAQVQHHYFATDGPFGAAQLKFAIQAVNDVDPTADVFADEERGLLHVRSTGGSTPDELRAALVTSGLALLPGHPVIGGSPRTTDMDGKPLYILTGDEAGDRARYEQAVFEWNLAHPEDPITLPQH